MIAWASSTFPCSTVSGPCYFVFNRAEPGGLLGCQARLNSKCHRCNGPAHRSHCWLTRILDGTSRQLKHRTLLPVAKTCLVLKRSHVPLCWLVTQDPGGTYRRQTRSVWRRKTKQAMWNLLQFHFPTTESKQRELISIKTTNVLLLSICDSFTQCQVSTYCAIMCRSPC